MLSTGLPQKLLKTRLKMLNTTSISAFTENSRPPVEISGKRPFEEAIVTAGGVALPEVNPRTMESKLVRGLYFAGEVLDLDAYTGGFNLQIAWSTAYTAGNAVN